MITVGLNQNLGRQISWKGAAWEVYRCNLVDVYTKRR